MNNFFLFTIAAALSLTAPATLQAQANAGQGADTGARKSISEKMPVFIGDLNKYLAENLHYPDSSRLRREEGRAVVRFVVNTNGLLKDIRIERSSGHAFLDQEALRVFYPMQLMPYWAPGMMDGKPVQIYFTMPINFHL